jgi:predicted ATPase
LIDVAHGIKSFGILQMLLENGYISEKGILIFDEPEVQLHPKWQLEYAKIIVNFVKYGIIVIVNSHSPYMIEALKKYSELFKIDNKTNFYLADNNLIYQEKESNALTLERIFEKLSSPFDTFEEIDTKLMEM